MGQRASLARRITGSAALALLLCGVSWSAEAYKSPASIETMDDATHEQIRRVVRKNIADVRHCYNQALEGNPTLAGGIVLHYKKEHSDKPGRATVKSADQGLLPVARCTATAMTSWDFGAFTGTVNYPFKFSPDE